MPNYESVFLGFFDLPSGIWIDVQVIGGGTRGAENDESDEQHGSDDDNDQHRFHLSGASSFGRTGVYLRTAVYLKMHAGRTTPHT
jgi:hypothetical protein